MEGAVNPRRYDAAGRQRSAADRRRRVLDAAVEIISAGGYVATTMAHIAAAAGVSVEYLYKTFGDKPRLVRLLLDYVAAGDEEPVPVVQRPEVQQMKAEPDPRTVLAMYARRCALVNARAAPLLLAMTAAAPGDAQLAAVVRTAAQQRLGAAAAVVTDIESKGRLRCTPDEARDTIWTLNAPEVWDLTVRRRGWSDERYAQWVGRLMADEILGSQGR